MSCNTQLPAMYVPKSVDECRVANFMKKKWPVLTQLIGRPETTGLYFSANDLISLFDNMAAVPGAPFGCRMYFASYRLTGEAAVDDIVHAGYDGQLTLIFSPTDGNAGSGFNDLGSFFIINPGGGVFPISENSANLMVLAYREQKLPLLEKIVIDAGIPDFEEGRAMWIAMDAFTGADGIIPEMTCQGASGLSACFAAYGKDETAPSGAVVSWQLTAVFILTKALVVDGKTFIYHFDIEDIAGFENRPPKLALSAEARQVRVQDVEDRKKKLRIQFDTINPCPPATNCGGLGHP